MLQVLLALLLCTSSVAPQVDPWADSPQAAATLIEKAFSLYVKRTRILTAGDVLVAAVPCRDDLCLQLSVNDAERDRVVMRLPQLLGGFGYGADVVSLTMETSERLYKAASVVLVARVSRRTGDMDLLRPRVQRLSAFLRTVGRMSSGATEVLNPRRVPPDRKQYFIRRLEVGESGRRMEITLLGPPKAPRPEQKPNLRVARQECYELKIEDTGDHEGKWFPDWKSYRLTWKWICKPQDKSIE